MDQVHFFQIVNLKFEGFFFFNGLFFFFYLVLCKTFITSKHNAIISFFI